MTLTPGMIGLASASLLSAITLLAQAPGDRPQFRTGVELVQLDVVVLDDTRQPVRGLTADDFEVRDNGAETPIRAFTPVELAPAPAGAAWTHEVAPDVAGNQIVNEDGRLVVILMDRSIPPHEPTTTARKIAAAAVHALGPNDLAAVVSTRNGAMQGRAVQNLTADRARLLRAIDAGDPSIGISPEAEGIMNKDGFQIDPLNDPACLCGVCVHEAITRVAGAVQDTPRRRKMLLFIGSTMIWEFQRPAGQASADTGCDKPLKTARDAMFAAIDRASLTVHAIDPRGLFNSAPQAHASTPNRSRASTMDGLRAALSESLEQRQNLTVLPDRTGGRTIVATNNPDAKIPAIFRESSAYYVIGIDRGVSTSTGRTVDVRVKRRGLQVVAQRRYAGLSAPPGVSAARLPASGAVSVDAALGGLLPAAGIPLSLAVAPLQGMSAARATVHLTLDVSGFARSDGTAVPLDLSILAVDRVGRPAASARQRSTIVSTRDLSTAGVPVDLPSHLELPPGDYGVRIAVTDPALGRTASVFSDITVPDFGGARLTMSGVSIEAAGGTPGVLTATTRRRFVRGEQARAAFQIYQGTARTDPPVPVAVRMQILDGTGAQAHVQSITFAPASFTNRGADCILPLPLGTLTPGEYLLLVDVSANQHESTRAVRFSVH